MPTSPQGPLGGASYLHLLQHGMVLNPREQHSHGIRAVVEEWDAGTIQVAGQLMDVCLQLCKGCGQMWGQGQCGVRASCLRLPSPFPACCLARITGPELKETNQCAFLCLSLPSLGQNSLNTTTSSSATFLQLSQS